MVFLSDKKSGKAQLATTENILVFTDMEHVRHGTREEGHAFLFSFELAGLTPDCLDWQPSQFINMVGKDEVSRVLVYEGL